MSRRVPVLPHTCCLFYDFSGVLFIYIFCDGENVKLLFLFRGRAKFSEWSRNALVVRNFQPDSTIASTKSQINKWLYFCFFQKYTEDCAAEVCELPKRLKRVILLSLKTELTQVAISFNWTLVDKDLLVIFSIVMAAEYYRSTLFFRHWYACCPLLNLVNVSQIGSHLWWKCYFISVTLPHHMQRYTRWHLHVCWSSDGCSHSFHCLYRHQAAHWLNSETRWILLPLHLLV